MNVQKVIKKVKCKATVCESPCSVPKGGNEDDATAQLGLWDVGLWWPTDTEMAFESQK